MSAGSAVCEVPSETAQRKNHPEAICPRCGEKGKAVQGKTIKSLLNDSFNSLPDSDYYFCRTQSCPLVYYSLDGVSTYATWQVREKVFQKEPDADDVYVCYCFKHTAAEIRNAAPEHRAAIVTAINHGIQANQCACDLRNPQGSCCLGNVHKLIKQTQQAAGQP